VWFVASWKIIGPAQVGIILFCGKPEECVYPSGFVFVPWCPFRWSGLPLWYLIRIPTKLFKLSYEGTEEYEIYTSDRQLVMPEVSFYVEFPYNEADSLIQMIKSGVPITEEKLAVWAEDILLPALRRILQKKSHTELIGAVDFVGINKEVNELLDAKDSPLRACKVTGRNPNETDPGTGRAFVEIETFGFTEGLQQAMQAPVEQGYLAAAAKETAKRNAEEVGGQVLGIVARAHGLTVEGLEADLKAGPENRKKYEKTFEWAQLQTMRDRGTGDGLTYTDAHIDINSGGKPITDPEFKGLALIAGALGAAAQLGNSVRDGGKKDNRRGDKSNREKNRDGKKRGKKWTSPQELAELRKTMSKEDIADMLMREAERNADEDDDEK